MADQQKKCEHDHPCNCEDADWLLAAPVDRIRLRAADWYEADRALDELADERRCSR